MIYMALNMCAISGRLTKDVEVRKTSNDVSVASFTVAVDRDYSKDGKKETDFINCVAWRNTAEFVSKYFSKGSMIIVEGKIQTRQYDDKDGNKRTAVEINVDQVNFAGSKSESSNTEQKPNLTVEVEESNEDLPF